MITKFYLRVIGLCLLLIVGVIGVGAQEETTPEVPAEDAPDNGQWVLYEIDVLSVRVPARFELTTEQEGLSQFTAPNGALFTIIVENTFDSAATTLDAIEAELSGQAPENAELLDEMRISLPTGEAFVQFLDVDAGNDLIVRQQLVYVSVGTNFVLLGYSGLFEPEDNYSTELGTFEAILNTVQRDEATIGQQAWPAFSSNDGLLTIQVPPDWEDAESALDTGLTLRQPDDLTLAIFSSTELESALDVEGFEDALLNRAEDEGETILESGLLELPVGGAAYVIVETPLELSDGTIIPQQQYRYIIMNRRTLINVTLIADSVVIDTYAPVFEAMMHTLRVNE